MGSQPSSMFHGVGNANLTQPRMNMFNSNGQPIVNITFGGNEELNTPVRSVL
jgi:hypothetical protein